MIVSIIITNVCVLRGSSTSVILEMTWRWSQLTQLWKWFSCEPSPQNPGLIYLIWDSFEDMSLSLQNLWSKEIEAILQGPLHGSQPSCFLTVVLEETLESLLDCRKIKPANPKGNQHWIAIGRSDAEAEAQSFGHLMWRADLLEKTWMLGKIEDKRKRGQLRMRWLDSVTDSVDRNLSILGDSEGQGSLACHSPWACKESDTT